MGCIVWVKTHFVATLAKFHIVRILVMNIHVRILPINLVSPSHPHTVYYIYKQSSHNIFSKLHVLSSI